MLQRRDDDGKLWTKHGRMWVREDVDPELVRAVYLELVRLEHQARNPDDVKP